MIDRSFIDSCILEIRSPLLLAASLKSFISFLRVSIFENNITKNIESSFLNEKILTTPILSTSESVKKTLARERKNRVAICPKSKIPPSKNELAAVATNVKPLKKATAKKERKNITFLRFAFVIKKEATSIAVKREKLSLTLKISSVAT